MFFKVGDVDSAMLAWQDMKQSGVDPSIVTFTTLLNGSVDANRLDITKEVYTQLQASRVRIQDVASWTTILKTLFALGEKSEAMQAWKRMKEENVQPNSYTYNELLMSNTDNETSKVIYDALSTDRTITWSVELYNTVIAMLFKRGDVETAIKEWKRMGQNGIKADRVTFIVMLNGCVNNSEHQLANSIYQEMKAASIDYDVALWTSIIKMHFANQNFDEILSIWIRVAREEISVNTILYMTLMNGYIEAQQYDMAKKVWDRMKHKNTNLSARDFNILIRNCIEAKMYVLAESIINELESSNITKNVELWTTCIKLMCTKGEFEKAIQALQEMKTRAVQPNLQTYAVLLNSSVTAERYDICMIVYNMIQEEGIIANPTLWGIIFKMFFAMKDYDKVKEAWDTIKHRVDSDEQLFIVLINGYTEAKQYEPALDIYNTWRGFHRDQTIYMYSTILKLFSAAGDFENVQSVWDEMKSKEVEVNTVIFGLLINGCVEAGKFDLAMSVYRDYQQQNLKADTYMWNVIIKLFCATGDYESASQCLEKMTSNATAPNIVSYTTLISAYIDARRYKPAMQLYKNFVSTNLVADVKLLCVIIKLFCAMGKHDAALKLVDKMSQESMQVDDVTFITLLSAADSVHKLSFFKRVVAQLNKSNISPSVALCNTLIDKYYDMDMPQQAIETFRKMTHPDVTTYRTVMSNYTSLIIVEELADALKNKANKSDFEKSVYVMCLGRQANIAEALQHFSSWESQDPQLWYAILYSCQLNGKGTIALQLLHSMIQKNLRPTIDHFQLALAACSYESSVQGAKELYQLAKDKYAVGNKLDITMIDVYSRSNFLDEAEALACRYKTDVAWITVLAGCKKFNDYNRAQRILQEHPYLEEYDNIMLMSQNIASSARDWEQVASIRSKLDERGFKKVAGKSSVLIDGQLHVFVVDDPNVSAEATNLIDTWLTLFQEKYGYKPDIPCVLKPYNTYEEKVTSLMRHSEKLAIATAMLQTNTKAVKVTKNLRMCMDCHTFAKHLSHHTQRTIVIIDRAFNHVFVTGKCTCNDKY
jgi:pentatricopeptide repeat protein